VATIDAGLPTMPYHHESLGMLTPIEYRLKHTPETANYGWH